jgi:vacuolar-type H+-ATPase subunit D/Vma8
MSYRLPRHFASQHREANVEALNHELLQESAETLGRLGRRMERALEALAAFDAAGGTDAAERDALVAAAGEAVWYYVVQREVMGLRDPEMLLRELGVPREVRLRMGVAPRRTKDRASP